MIAKKDKTEGKCNDVIAAYHDFSRIADTTFCVVSGFLYATETDKADKLLHELKTIMYKARERAERELDAKPRKRTLPPPVDLTKVPDFDPTDKWEDE